MMKKSLEIVNLMQRARAHYIEYKFLRETDGAVSIAAYDKFLVLLFQLSLSPSTEPLVNGPSSSTLLIYSSNTLGISPNGRQFLLARQYFQS